jgi:4-aminobutyrate aminotransferase
MTSSKTIYRAGYGPHAAGIFVAPHPYYRDRDQKHSDTVKWTIEQLEVMLLQQTTVEETAAVIIEPVLGEGGYVPPPAGLLQGIRDFCDRHGLLFIADEVQSGFGRTGRMFAVERDGVSPDVLVFAKGVASGMPLAGIASRRELMDKQPAGSQGGTYAGNAIACAAANATMDVMMETGFLDEVQARGKQLTEGFLALQATHPEVIKEVRGPGLMIGVEFDNSKVEKGFAGKISKACLARGMIVLPTGIFETLRIIPPLTVSASECEHGLALFGDALRDVLEAS